MKLKEYQGKALFKKVGIPTPTNYVITKPSQVKPTKQNKIVKVQILTGKRGKGGGVKIASPKELKKTAATLLKKKINGYKVEELLIEQVLNIQKEFYLSIIIDGFHRKLRCIFSEEGGMDIEELSKNHPNKIISFLIEKGTTTELNKNLKKTKYRKQIIPIIQKLHTLIQTYDADLVEINPLILTKSNKIIAADSKVTIDDNALYRQPDFTQTNTTELTVIEKKAREKGLQYVELDGDISVIGDGAGLVMSTLDILNYFKGSAANFLDVGGGASIEKMEQAMGLVQMKKTKGIFINIFGGITRCDEIAQGIINYKKKKKMKIPLVVRMTGTNDKVAKQLLKKNGIHSYDSMEQCAKKIIALTKKKK